MYRIDSLETDPRLYVNLVNDGDGIINQWKII